MCLTYVKHLAGSYLTVSLRSTTVRHMSSSFLTSADVAAILRRTERTVVRLAAAGELPYIFKGNGQRGAYLFDPHVVEMYARHRRDRRVQAERGPAQGPALLFKGAPERGGGPAPASRGSVWAPAQAC